MQHYLALVHNGKCQLLSPAAKSDSIRRLTQVFRQEARSPESGALDLSEFESCLIFIEGLEDGEWVYAAQILDQCDVPMSDALLALLKNEPMTQAKGDSKR